MKNYIVLFSLFFYCHASYSQIAFYDAQKLQTAYHVGTAMIPGTNTILASSADSVLTILKKYVPVADSSNKDSIIKRFIGNPFIQIDTSIVRRGSTIPSVANNISGAIGGLDVTTIADGLAQWIVKRTKQELNMAFFEKFKETLSKPEFKDLQTVFPQTYNSLIVIGDQIYNYQTYLQTLREAFNSDLSTMADHLPSIIDNHPDFFVRYRSLAVTLRSSCYIASELKNKTHPGDILKDYPDDFLDSLNPNWKASIQTLQLVSASLKDTAQSSDSAYWVSANKIKALLNNGIAFRIYLGLVYQQAKNNPITFQDGAGQSITVTSILDNVNTNVTGRDYIACQNYFKHFGDKIDGLNRMITSYRKLNSDSLTTEQYTAYFDASVDLLQYATQLSTMIPQSLRRDVSGRYEYLLHLKDTLSHYFDVAHSASHIVLDINRRNYSSAVMDLVHIYSLVHQQRASVEVASYSNAISRLLDTTETEDFEKISNSIVNGFKSDTIETYINRINQSGNPLNPYVCYIDTIFKYYTEYNCNNGKYLLKAIDSSTVLQTILKYGTFMATVVQAKTPDDVENAIESFALPPGSSRIKRESAFNVSLNAYCGLFTGYERITGLGLDKCIQINSYGVTAPIGVSISKGYKHWSYSAFVSIVDLGAVAAFRFNDTSVSQVPKVQLKDIVSPGLFFSLGIPKCPLSLNLGTQMGPNLRGVGVDENKYANNVYWRYSISLVVDIPVLNLYTKSAN